MDSFVVELTASQNLEICIESTGPKGEKGDRGDIGVPGTVDYSNVYRKQEVDDKIRELQSKNLRWRVYG